MKLPQLRLIATDFCDSKCIYCRPSGEAVCKCENNNLSLTTAIEISRLYKEMGGKDIKITGGDPVYWKNLVDCVDVLKNELFIEKVEVITRSVKIKKVIDVLISKGLDSINFSLDTLNKEKYNMITGKNDLLELLEVIKYCSSKLHCKINTVVMKGINDDEIEDLINFCNDNGIEELKLLDIITDLHKSVNSNSDRLDKACGKKLENLYTNLDFENKICFDSEPVTIFQGGLGHPLKVYKIGDLDVIMKDASNGAWYGECCNNCEYYPCHDALMALRVLPNNNLQICLMNERNLYKINNDEVEDRKQFSRCLKIYKNARFHRGENINE
ncbi:MAG: radical SAM protein [Bacilli bacterium]|nr:radical SAM protein [Bacilli bacterium]